MRDFQELSRHCGRGSTIRNIFYASVVFPKIMKLSKNQGWGGTVGISCTKGVFRVKREDKGNETFNGEEREKIGKEGGHGYHVGKRKGWKGSGIREEKEWVMGFKSRSGMGG